MKKEPETAVHRNLNIVYFKAQGLGSKYIHLFELAQVDKPDVIAVTETWLPDDIDANEYQISGFTSFVKNRNLAIMKNACTSEQIEVE